MVETNFIISFTLLFIVLEIYEVSWQKAPTMMEMLAKMYKYYANNIFIFLLMQPTFYFGIAFVMLTNYNTYALIFLFLKTIDVATKIILLQQIFVKEELSTELSASLLTPLHKAMPYISLTIYTPLIILAFI